ncbi:MAG: response regulator [Dehalococcoidia bacterium]|nr:response regulator [Dehalococcoidia bacterium]
MNILIVEDDPIDMKLLSAVLNYSGHRVLEKASAEQAADEIKARKPEVILLDLKLPGMDGLALARRLKQDPASKHIPIVAITSVPETFSKSAALAAGCDAYIVKPVDTRKLNAQVMNTAAHQSGPPEHKRTP